MKYTSLFFLLLFAFAAYGQQGQSFLDSRDGKKYKAVKIGNQIWMGENLNYDANGSKCYKNKPENCTKYGRLYDWETAMKACPLGWHLPSKSEYETLEKYVGGKKVAGEKLKTKSGWDNNGNGTDDYGFSVLPSGSGGLESGQFGNLWSASEVSSDKAYNWVLYKSNDNTVWWKGLKRALISVRCLQD
jgi:uncharacterized protein (TIGR02145 family)